MTSFLFALMAACITLTLGVLANWVIKPQWASRHPGRLYGAIAGLAFLSAVVASFAPASTASNPASTASTGVAEDKSNTSSTQALPTGSLSTEVSTEGASTPSIRTSVASIADNSAPQVLPYEANWSSGPDGWVLAGGWKVLNGMLVNDGSFRDTRMTATAPVVLGRMNDYAVDADMAFVGHNVGTISGKISFGVVVREDGTGGYGAGFCSASGIFTCGGGQSPPIAVIWSERDANAIRGLPFQVGTVWHHYRLEVKGNTIKFQIDGNPVLSIADNRYTEAGQVGLWSENCQVNVKSFKVTPL